MAAGLFIISILALVASASADCSTSLIGHRTGLTVIASDGPVPAGSYIVTVPSPCGGGMYEVGAKAVACADVGYVKVIARDLENMEIYSDYGAHLTVTAYCFGAAKGHQTRAPRLQ